MSFKNSLRGNLYLLTEVFLCMAMQSEIDPLGALVGLSYHQAIVQTVPNSLTFELEKGK